MGRQEAAHGLMPAGEAIGTSLDMAFSRARHIIAFSK